MYLTWTTQAVAETNSPTSQPVHLLCLHHTYMDDDGYEDVDHTAAGVLVPATEHHGCTNNQY